MSIFWVKKLRPEDDLSTDKKAYHKMKVGDSLHKTTNKNRIITKCHDCLFIIIFRGQIQNKAKASFFGDFKGAMSSVQNAFGKLLNDVVSDVKTTMGCTILAVEQVLAMNGIIREPLPNKNCYNDYNKESFDIKTKIDNIKFHSEKDIVHDISSAISKVNKTLSYVLDDGHEKLKDVKKVLKNESNRLGEVSFLLRKELEKISQKMKKEFQNIDFDSNISSLESARNNLKILYEVKKTDKNVSEEIGQVLNQALDVLHINMVNEVTSDEDKINFIMQKLEQESNNKNVLKNTINRESSQLEGEQSSIQNKLGHKVIPKETPKTFQDVATKLFKQNSKIVKEVHDYITNNSSSFLNSKSTKNTQTKNVDAENSNADSVDNAPFGLKNNKDRVKAINEAMDILKNSASTQTLLDNFFSKEHGDNVFDNSNLFNFEK